jgi:hypothetical protein
MTAPIRPSGVQAFGKEKWAFVPAIADTAAPTVAEVTSASGLDLTGYLYADQFEGTTIDQGTNTSPRRIADTRVFGVLGTSTYNISPLVYSFDPQAAALSNGKKAFEKLTPGTTGYLVRRFGIDRNTDFAAGQFIDVFAVTFGDQNVIKTAADETGEVAISQPVSVNNVPVQNVAIAA